MRGGIMRRRQKVAAVSIVVATIFVLAPSALAATSATKTSTPARPPLVTIDFVGPSRGWAAGAGQILRTDDGGATWRVWTFPKDGEVSIDEIGFWDRQTGCAADLRGAVWRTSTGGRTWVHRAAGHSGEYVGLALRPSHAWATYAYVRDDDEHTEAYSWLSTSSDGGDNWSPAPAVTATGGALADLDFVSEARGWAAGSQSVYYKDSDGNTRGYNVALIARSDDGGATWPVRLGPAELGITRQRSHLWALDFKGRLCGWAVGDAGRYENPRIGLILRTADGGKTWTARTFDHFWSILHVSMATTKVGWATGDSAPSWQAYKSARNRILKTTDGGRSWRVQYLPRGLHAVDIDAVSTTTAFVAGTRGSTETGGMVARTTDGGAHWMRVW